MEIARILLLACVALSTLDLALAKISREDLLQVTNDCIADKVGIVKGIVDAIAKQLLPGAGPTVIDEAAKAKYLKLLDELDTMDEAAKAKYLKELRETNTKNANAKSQPASAKREWTPEELEHLKAQKIILEAYVESIDQNFDLKCGFMERMWDDVKKAVKSTIFPFSFITHAKKELTPMEQQALSQMPGDKTPIRNVLRCVRKRYEARVASAAMTTIDGKEFFDAFGNNDATDAENEIFLNALRSIRCSIRFDPESDDILGDMKKILPSLMWGRLKKLYESIQKWVECLMRMKQTQEFEWSDLWGCNGNWDIWNGQKCLARVNAKEDKMSEAASKTKIEETKTEKALESAEVVLPESLIATVQEASRPVETEKVAPEKAAVAAPGKSQTTAKTSAPDGKMKQLSRFFYNRMVCRWSRAQDREDKRAKSATKPASRTTRGAKATSKTEISCQASAAAWFLLAVVLAALGTTQTIFAGVGGGVCGFLAGLVVGVVSGGIFFFGACIVPLIVKN